MYVYHLQTPFIILMLQKLSLYMYTNARKMNASTLYDDLINKKIHV